MSLAHSALLAAQEAAIAAKVASTPTPLIEMFFDGNVNNTGSAAKTPVWIGTAAYVTGNGGGQAADIADASNYVFIYDRTDLAGMTNLSVWIDLKVDTITGYANPLFSNRYEFRLHSTYDIYWFVNDLGISVNNPGLFDGNWHRVVGTYNGSTGVKTLYIDGSQVAQNIVSASNVGSPDYNIFIGRCAYDPPYDYPFDGKIDNLKIYNAVVAP